MSGFQSHLFTEVLVSNKYDKNMFVFDSPGGNGLQFAKRTIIYRPIRIILTNGSTIFPLFNVQFALSPYGLKLILVTRLSFIFVFVL